MAGNTGTTRVDSSEPDLTRPVGSPVDKGPQHTCRGITNVNHSARIVLLTLAVVATSIAATRPIAMRVDIEPLRAAGADTVVEVSIQIAPEDRSAIGRRVVLQMELTREKTTIDRVARSVDLDSNGQARVEVAWPPGAYDVRIEVEGATGEESGLWLGKTRVPRFEPETPPAPGSAEAAAATVAGSGLAATSPAPPPRSDAAAETEPPAQSPREAGTVEEAAEPVGMAAPTVADWGRDDPALADLTLLVTDRSRPVPGLDRDSLELRVNGAPTAIESMGSAANTPLFLGLAVDTSASMAGQLPEMSRLLSGLAIRTLGSEGGLFLVTADPEPTVALAWGATPSDLANALARPGRSDEVDVIGLITTALDQFQGRTGRTFLIVVTDGAHVTTKSDWKNVTPVVDAAGIPIFVLGVRAETLKDRARRDLDRLAASTGGKSYLVQESGMLNMTIDHIADLIAGSYAIRFQRSTGTELNKIAISTGNKDHTVLHPKTVR
jgi:hypothetical protein